ncbi:transposase [Burkholderia pseudomallei]|uniref:transposase n=1 Tax=Burkholderia pseudomallei TaxID=28450 RepID=UPI0010358CBD|nr:transposase [Burkholderia pseudomallei]QBI49769.1 hypothetical protein EXY72_25815 [Burkholderia pseudomallei]
MKRCPECATSRPYELSDGRYKCRSCGKKFSWTWVWDVIVVKLRLGARLDCRSQYVELLVPPSSLA